MARLGSRQCLLKKCVALLCLATSLATIQNVMAQGHSSSTNYHLIQTFRQQPGSPDSSRIYTQLLRDAMSGRDSNGVAVANEMMNVFSSERYAPLELKAYIAELLANPPTRDITAVCYAEDADDIRNRCPKAQDFANSVYVQLMDTVRRPEDSVKFEKWDPWAGATVKDNAWFDALKNLGRSSRMKVIGMYFGKQNDETLNELVKRHSSDFAGIFFVNEYGHGVCWTQLQKPRKFFRYGMLWNWLRGLRMEPRYLMSNQDADACTGGNSSGDANNDIFANVNDRDIEIQDWILPVFPCYDGREWRCFDAFQKYPAIACDTTKQRYAFSPYRYSSSATLRYYLEHCRSNTGKIPGFDLVEVL